MLQRPIFNSAVLILVCAISVSSSLAQVKPGVKQSALRFADISRPVDIFTTYYNPAASEMFRQMQIATYYSPAPYGLSELKQFGIQGVYPTPDINMTIGVYNYGFSLYNETHALLNFSFSPYRNIYTGINLVGENLKIERYGNSFALRIDLGALIVLNEDISVSFAAANVNSAQFSGSENSIPRTFRTGISYRLFENLTLNGAVESEDNFEPDVKIGISLKPHKIISVSTGYSKLNGELALGGSLLYAGVSFDYTYIHHKVLGSTNVLGITVPDVTSIF